MYPNPFVLTCSLPSFTRPTNYNRLHWRERKVAFGFQLFSACLSLTVGVLWLVLKSCGLLEQVFG